jgi:hypothetical protein
MRSILALVFLGLGSASILCRRVNRPIVDSESTFTPPTISAVPSTTSNNPQSPPTFDPERRLHPSGCMKAITLLASASLYACLALACSPVELTNHPGSPPAVNEQRRIKTDLPPLPKIGNSAPHKYGIPYLLEYARNQAGQVGPDAQLSIQKEQLQFAETAGRNYSAQHLNPSPKK